MDLFPKPPSIMQAISQLDNWPNVVHDEFAQRAVNVKWFGAKGDGVTDDTSAIQNAINSISNNGGVIFLPAGTYIITSPLLLPSNVVLIGQQLKGTIIQKNTNTVGITSSRIAPNRTSIIDSYAVDNIISLVHADNDYTYGVQIKNLTLKSGAPSNINYAIYAPRTSQLTLKDIQTINCNYGFFTYDSWLTIIDNFTSYNCASVIKYANDGSGNGTGTALTATKVWANTANNNAYDIFGLGYSVFNGCAVDHVTLPGIFNGAYFFDSCHGIILNGCGAEDITGCVIYNSLSELTINGFYTYQIIGTTRSSDAYLHFDGGNTVFNACKFNAFTSPYNSSNMVIQNGAKITAIQSILPTGGNSWISYSDNSVLNIIDDKGITSKTNIDIERSGIITSGRRIFFDTAPPTTGAWNTGDLIYNTSPAAGGKVGWVCIAGGTPGTWKAFGAIDV